ncbi:bacillithiol biosynthesis cysteine-adding enzyme BshC [Paenibacillus sp. J2TS4]|uniref:bacillithiol biosynthesis cysteine-adding enzyme BshC n=1 Tax=Paenibacillus sp. J2TS4 TaxID=2807194 RepID=UPI001AFEC760|nr:bacillithiol biosynthesis cysteine-adding enzyme BshC [Paenibacillus sp. J2TS4]GIP36380.1 putative cysteine ligase BshC [Paenibacillus sp. J2TS4]
MKLEPYERSTGQSLAEDYKHRFERVRDLYVYNVWDETCWEERAAWLDQSRFSANRTELVHSLIRYNDRLGNDPESFEALEQLRRPETLVIVGGQQAGLFTGPLLVIYKAATIIQAARQASEQLKRPVVPVFWIAGEDHDFEEVNHAYTLTPQLQVEKLKLELERPMGTRTSISRLTIDNWEDALNQLDNSLLDTEFKAPLLEKLMDAAGKSKTLTEFFGRMMAWLFGKHGLILLDSDDAGIRKLEGPMFTRLLEHRHEVNHAVLSGWEQVKRLGYSPQAEAHPDSANLFIFEDDGERVLLYRDGESLTDRKKERRYDPQQLLEWVSHQPERFSNNVMTRPVMQDYLLPVLGAVLGPGEIAYWGMTRSVFEVLGMQMPILLPRRELTLMEGTVQKHMEKFGWTIEDVLYRFDEKKNQWLREQDQLKLEERFAEVKEQFLELYRPILETVASINPGMSKLGKANEQKIIEQIEFLETRSTEANQAQHEAALRQLERIRLSLLPLGRDQERVYNVFSYLNKYGTDWVDELVSQPLSLQPVHSIVYM